MVRMGLHALIFPQTSPETEIQNSLDEFCNHILLRVTFNFIWKIFLLSK